MYDLGNREIVVTLNNACANNIAIEILRPLVSGFHDEFLQQMCVCHIINLIVNFGLDIVQETILKIR